MTPEQMKELAESAQALLVKICPPEEFGEDSDCEVLYNILEQFKNNKYEE